MPEVIPNWHPLFVHFPIALLSMATLFFVIPGFVKSLELKAQIRVLAYWNLWLGTGFALITALAGWFAFNSVAHDAPSHAAMTEHRNWALLTLLVFILISAWSFKQYKSSSGPNTMFSVSMVVAFVLLVSTAWHGSEVVYRYGLGVMSLPSAEGEGHDHHHEQGTMTPGAVPEELHHEHGEHDHSHE